MSRRPKPDPRPTGMAWLFDDHRARSMALFDALPPLTRAALRDVEHPCAYTAWDLARAFGDAYAAERLAPGAAPLTELERETMRVVREQGRQGGQFLIIAHDCRSFVTVDVPPDQPSLF